jgi:carbon monoxide dehydrogenase subunit G
MKFVGHYRITAPRLSVWEALNDTEVLKACIPGCDRIEWVDSENLEASITVNLGIMKPTFSGDLTLSNVEPARAYTLSGGGRGGLLGLARGSADIELQDWGLANEACILKFEAHGEVSGSIEKLGSKIVGKSAQGVIDRFFSRFAAQIDAEAIPVETEDAAGTQQN